MRLFGQTFMNINNILHKDARCGSELNYIEQTSWILFLQYLDDTGKAYTPILDPYYRQENRAAPKMAESKIHHNRVF